MRIGAYVPPETHDDLMLEIYDIMEQNNLDTWPKVFRYFNRRGVSGSYFEKIRRHITEVIAYTEGMRIDRSRPAK